MERNDRPPRDPRRLLAEMDARMRVRDIREIDRLRGQAVPQWWEPVLLAVLFLSGVGMIITIAKLAPRDTPLLYEFILFWCGLFVLASVGTIEFLYLKFQALRRLHENTLRILEEHDHSLQAIRNHLEAHPAVPDEG